MLEKVHREPPLVSVCIRTYNQEKFVRDAIDSAIWQKVNFEYEIIISDDCSTDSTPLIIKEYQQAYPDKVIIIRNQQNIGGPNNLKRVIEASNAKYICCLDGDDFFTDEYKLQKQVDFLEEHNEYSACFHNTWIVDENGRKMGLFNRPDFPEAHDAIEFIKERWFVPIHSAVLRKKYIEFPEWYDTVMNDDYVVHLSVVKNAPYYFMPEPMAAYRKHADEISTAYKNIILVDTQLKTILEKMKSLYPDKYGAIFDSRIAEYEREILEEKLLADPVKKWLCKKTYTRKIKSLFRDL